MRYHEVSDALEAGKKIKIKQWEKAYWFMKDGIIINHDEHGIDVPTIHPALFPWSVLCVWQKVTGKLSRKIDLLRSCLSLSR